MALPAHIVDNVTPIGAAVINPLIDEQEAWTVDKNGGAHNLSNVATLTFTTLGGNVAGNSKSIKGLSALEIGTASSYSFPFSIKGGGFQNAIIESSDAISGAQFILMSASDSGSGWSIGKRDDGLASLPVGSFAIAKGSLIRFFMTPAGAPAFPATPTSSSGLASGALWRDPAATTKTAGASYTANEQAMLNEIKAYLASVVKQVP